MRHRDDGAFDLPLPPGEFSLQMTVLESAAPVTEVALAGRLDAAGADAIGVRFSAAVASPGRDALVDLSQVNFVASMGMRLLVSTARALQQKQCRLVVHGAPELVLQALQDAALDQIVPCAANRDDALARLAG